MLQLIDLAIEVVLDLLVGEPNLVEGLDFDLLDLFPQNLVLIVELLVTHFLLEFLQPAPIQVLIRAVKVVFFVGV